MKRIKLLTMAIAAVVGTVSAQRNTTSFTYKNLIQPRLHELNVKDYTIKSRCEQLTAERRLQATAPDETRQTSIGTASNGFFSGAQLHRTPEAQTKQRLDSIVTTVQSTGAPYSKQQFSLDENNLPIKRVNSLWDDNKGYYPVEVYEFTWDADGYCLSQSQTSELYGSGVKIEYVYNDRKLGIQQIQSFMNADGSWTPSSKGEYKYDDNGNIIEEYTYNYDVDKKAWTPLSHNLAAWNNNGWMTMFEGYYWDGTEWVGNGEKKEYAYLSKDKMTQVKSYIWLNDEKQWFWYCNYEQDFNDRQLCTRIEKRFYNREYNDWGGHAEYYGTIYENNKSLMEYYDDGRHKYDKSYGSSEHGVYTLGADWTYEWSDLADGGKQCYQEASIYDDSGTKTITGIFVDGYDAAGNQNYMLEKQRNWSTGEITANYERDWTYNEKGLLINEHTYTLTENGTKPHGDLAVEYTYDANDNLVSRVNYMQKSDDGNDDGGMNPLSAPHKATDATSIEWVYTTKNEFAYEQDSILVQNYFYRWNNEKWNMLTGERDYYDYDTPLSDVIIWLGYNGYHKMDKMLTYISGTDEDFYVNNYCYSTVQTASIHGTPTADVAIRVYPTLVDNGFTVDAPADTDVHIFSTNGTCLAKTKAGYIPAQNLPAGLYVVVAGGTKTKIVKK